MLLSFTNPKSEMGHSNILFFGCFNLFAAVRTYFPELFQLAEAFAA